MKVLIVRSFPDVLQLDSYNVQEIGLAKALVCKGIECGVVLYNANNADRTEVYSFDRGGKSYSFCIYWLKGFSILKNGFMPSLRKLINRYDIIQVHEYDQILSWQIYSKMKKPTVVYHGPYYDQFAKGYNLKCKIFDATFLKLRKHDQVVALTKSELASSFLRKKGFRYVKTVGVGIDRDNFIEEKGEQVKTLIQRDASKVRLLYVGKIEERRNVFFLIDLFERLRESDDCYELIIVGNGEPEYLENFRKRIKKWTDGGEIKYFQRATQKELALIYQNVDLFIFTSNYDIFGMVLLEALFFGLPVISTMNGGASVLIDEGINGYVVDTFDVGIWKKRVENIIKDGDRYIQMKKAAHEGIEEKFLWDKLVEQFIEGYYIAEEILKKGREE